MSFLSRISHIKQRRGSSPVPYSCEITVSGGKPNKVYVGLFNSRGFCLPSRKGIDKTNWLRNNTRCSLFACLRVNSKFTKHPEINALHMQRFPCLSILMWVCEQPFQRLSLRLSNLHWKSLQRTHGPIHLFYRNSCT